MALSNETQAWLEGLAKDGGLSAEAVAQIRTSLEGQDKADQYIKGSALRQSDYSRNMAAVQKAQQELEAAQQQLLAKEQGVTQFQMELGTWKAGAEGRYKTALQEREQALLKANAAVAKLKTVAATYGIDEAELFKDLEVTPVEKKPDTQTVDTSEFLKKADVAQAMRESLILEASVADIAAEYEELTGKRLKGARALVEEAIKSGKPLQQFVDEKLNLPELRTKAAAKAQQEHDDAIRAEERAKIASEGLLPGNQIGGLRTDLKGSPIFTDAAKIPSRDQQPGGGVSGAVAAFQAGKYKH